VKKSSKIAFKLKALLKNQVPTATMAPDDTRNIFYNGSNGSKVEEQLPSLVLPVVFPHHLLMMAVASTASKLTNVKSCTHGAQAEGMENIAVKSANTTTTSSSTCPQPSTTNTPSCTTETTTTRKEQEEDQSEIRLIIEMTCTVQVEEDSPETKLSLLLRFEDHMNRQLNCSVAEDETGVDLADELVHFGLISELDRDKVAGKINEHLDLP